MTTATSAPRTTVRKVAVVLVGVVVVQVLFAASYLAAFGDPQPHGVPIAVAGPSPSATTWAVAALRNTAGDALAVQVAPSTDAARLQVRDRSAYAAYLTTDDGDELVVASAASASVARLLTDQFSAQAARTGRALQVTDLVPLPSADSRGVAPFYLTLVMVFGGYLGVTVLGLLAGTAATRLRGATQRITGLAAYSVVSAAAVVLTARLGFGVLAGAELAATLFAALICFATAAVSVSLQAMLGTLGTGAVILLFVVLGNPSSGGAVAYELLPRLMSDTGRYLVNGAGVDALRDTVYFPDAALTRPVVVLFAWALAGATGALSLGAHQQRRLLRTQADVVDPEPAGL